MLQLLVGFSLACVTVDVLHVVDLGVSAHMLENVFAACIRRDVWGGGTVKRNAEALGEAIKKWYQKQKNKTKMQGLMTWSRLKTDKGWPKIKCKVAASRHLMALAHDLAQEHCSYDPRIIAITQLMFEFYTILEGEKLHMREEAVKRIEVIGEVFLQDIRKCV